MSPKYGGQTLQGSRDGDGGSVGSKGTFFTFGFFFMYVWFWIVLKYEDYDYYYYY